MKLSSIKSIVVNENSVLVLILKHLIVIIMSISYIQDNEKVGTKQDGVGRLEELQRTKELELEKERLGKENKSLENG